MASPRRGLPVQVLTRTVGRGLTHLSRARASRATLAGLTVAILFAFLIIGMERARTQSSGPGGVVGAALWVKANAGLQVNGSNQVQQWLDQSGSGNITTELRAATPTHTDAIVASANIIQVPGAINFNPAVDFTGAAGRSLKGNAVAEWDTGALSIFAVSIAEGASVGNISAVWDSLASWTTDPNSAGAGALVNQTGANYTLDSNGFLIAPTTSPIDRPRVLRALYPSATTTLGGSTWLDGVQEATGSAASTSVTTLFEVGGRTAGAATFDNRIFNGKIAEVVVFKSALTAASANKVESYLAVKYGITLRQAPAAQNYVDSGDTIIWDATANATYSNNIAGIGRDDLATQDQRQSRSINTAGVGNLVTIGNGTIAADNPSNPNLFGADRIFMIWGDNGGSIAPMTPIVSAVPGLKRMARVWKVQETGAVGTVLVRVPVANMPGSSPMLLRSTDATFASGNTLVPMVAVASNYEASIDLATGDFFTFASVMPSPGGIVNGLEYWIRPDDMTVSGGVTTNWDDVYGLHTNETFAGGGFTVGSGFNFHPTASTNGDRYIAFLSQQLLSGAPAGEIFYMLESTGAHNTNDGYPSEFGGGGSAQTWEYDFSDSNVYSGWGSTVRKVWNPLLAPAGGPPRDVLDPHIYNVLSAPGTWTARFDGLTNFTTATNTISFNSSPSTHTYVGASSFSIFKGRLSEVIVYRRGLSAVERQSVQSYLATKYGVTLGTTTTPIDYLAADGTTVYWTGAATYQSNVAGIGRDDAAGLHQRQSQSVNTASSGNLVTMGLGTIAVDNASNPNNLSTDNSFLVWGDDGAAATFTVPTASPVPGALARMPRTWRVQETGTVGQVRVGVPATLGSTLPVYLVVSNDAAFDQTDQWTLLTPFTVGAASYRAADVDVGNGQFFTFAVVLPLDYGDAPATYGTLLADDGARHGLVSHNSGAGTAALMLGGQVSAETDGQPSAGATADAFDNGVVFPTLLAGQPATATVTVTNSGPAARLSAWADWNSNGSFADAGELILSDLAVTGGSNSVSITPPASIGGPIVFRFRLSTQAGLGPTGVAGDGEVEDYQVTVMRQSDLQITKTDGQAGYTPGAAIGYTVVVTNPGPSNASPFDISDTVPAAITGVSVGCVATGVGSCGTNNSSGNNVSFTGASLNAGAGNTLTLTVSGTVNPGATGNLTNTAQLIIPAGAGFTDPNLGNNTATDTDTQGTPVIDLAITKNDGQTSYVPGASITYTLAVTNAGPSTATGFSLSDVLPPGISGVTANCAVVGLGNCGTNASAGTSASFTSLMLAPGAVNALTFAVTGTVSPGTTGTLTNTATVTAGVGSSEPNLTNNSATDVDTQGAGQADLAIAKTDGQAGSIPGTAVSYTLTVTNLGPSHAPSFEIHDLVPSTIGAVTVTCTPSGTASCGTNGSSGNAIAFTGATLNAGPGHRLTLSVSGLVDPSYTGGSIVNTAQVVVPTAAGYSDPQLGNNTISDTNTALAQQVDLAITKTDGRASYTPGAPVTYTLVVTNGGPSTASSITVADAMPSAITGVSASCVATGIASCGSNASVGSSVVFNNASVYPGAGHRLTITITGRVSPDTTGNLVNTATVAKGIDATEPNLANNTATDTDTQGANVADLSITKTDGASSYTAGTAITYQVVVTNNGPSHASGFTVGDPLPSAILGPVVTCAVTSGIGSCGTNASAGSAISFAGVSLNAGSALTLTITGTIDPSATGDLVNTATITVPGSASFTDPDAADNTATDTDTAGTQTIDLAVTKSDSQTTYVPGAPVTYTVTITNSGPSTATGFSIGDVVPAAITGPTVNCVATGASSCGSNSSSGQNLLFSNATLVPGDTITLTIAGTIAPDATADLTNTASVVRGFGVIDTNAANDSASDTDTQASAQTDLAIVKTDGQTTYVPGSPVSYTITVTNSGPSLATGFSFTDVAPVSIAGLTVSCAVTGTGSCGTNATAGNNVSFTDLALAPGAGNQLTFTIGGVVNASATGSLVNTATVAVGAGSSDPNPANNSATDTDTAVVQADISVSKTGPSTVTPGTSVAYTITVTNNGPSVSAPATLSDPPPPGLTLVDVTGACSALPCALGQLAPAEVRVATVQMSVPPDYSGSNPILNTATVASSTDPNAANDSASASAVVTTVADVSVTKTGPATVAPGSTLTYTITVTSAGPSSATSVTLDDPTPPGLTLESVSGACTTLPCALGTIAPGEVRAIFARYRLPLVLSGAPTIVNTASVSSPTFDPTPADTSATATTLVASGRTCDVNGDGVPDFVTGAGPGGGPHVRVFTFAGGALTELASFYAYDPAFRGGVSVACGDVTGDGIAEILTGAGPGGGPHVRVLNVTGGVVTELTGFYAYDSAFQGGVFVAAGDVTGDGKAEIITGAGPGGGPHVRVLEVTGSTVTEIAGFYAYDPAFTGAIFPGGVFVSAGDLTGDGRAEIVTGAGPGGGPHVRVLQVTGSTVSELVSFYAYDPAFTEVATFHGGVTVAIADMDGDGMPEIITGAGVSGGPHVRVLRLNGSGLTEIAGMYAYDVAFSGGVFVAAGDLDGDGVAELITGAGPGGGPHVRLWRLSGGRLIEIAGFYAYDALFRGGVLVGR